MSRRYARILATVVFLFALGLSMLCAINYGYAAQNSSVKANPRLIYWPNTIVWRSGNYISIGNGWVNAKSIVYETRPYVMYTDEWKVLIVDMESGTLAYNFSIDMGQNVWANIIPFAFSPDDTKIFYVKVPNTGYLPQIFSVNLDGTGSTFVMYMNSTSVNSMRRPFVIDVTSGDFIVYASCETIHNVTIGQYIYTNYIWKHNLATNEKSLVLQLEGMDKLITSLKVSPSNNKVAYAVGSEVWIADINGAEPPIKVTSASSGKNPRLY